MKELQIRLQDLIDQRGKKITDLDTLVKSIEENGEQKSRSFTDEEKQQNIQLKKSITELDEDIADVRDLIDSKQRVAEFEAERLKKAGKISRGGEARDKKSVVQEYSFLKVIKAAVSHQPLDGVEREMHDEAQKEARELGVSMSGTGVPSFFMEAPSRGLDAATAATAADTIATNLGALIPALRPKMRVRELGAKVLTGLVGDFDLPRQTGLATATWDGEKDTATETTPTFDKISLKPHRLSAYTEFSRQILIQSSLPVEAMVRGELSGSIGRMVDFTAINGSGVGNIPEGILNNPNVIVVPMGNPDGGVPTHTLIIAMETGIEDENAEVENMAWLTNPKVKGKLKSTKVDAGSAVFLMQQSARELLGYRFATSTLVPKDLGKGAGTDLSAMIFGNWNQLNIGQWGGIDMIINPYSKDREAEIRVTTHSFWDLAIAQPKAFSISKDIITV